MVSYIVLRGPWCNTVVLNGHSQSEEKSDDSKDSFYEEIEKVFFNHFLKYNKIGTSAQQYLLSHLKV